MSTHPYSSIPPHQRWGAAMVQPAPTDVDPVVEMPFRITREDRIATAGSCFAQHIGRHLAQRGFHSLLTEMAHPIVPDGLAASMQYGVYTARYGNVYTVRQALQLFQRAYGSFVPREEPWTDGEGHWFDPFRPAIQPGGFESREELEVDRAQHLGAVRLMFETADVLVFTLGLTETWFSQDDGAVFPVCPGVSGGSFDASRHAFVNVGVEEVVSDLREFLSLARSVRPGLRVILTVSPVPLAATAEPRHVWTSTTYSKSVLRVAAEVVAREPLTAYFPSYEIVTAPSNRGAYYDEDLRTVRNPGVEHVMRVFFRHLAGEELPAGVGVHDADLEARRRARAELQHAREAVDVICEENALDSAAGSTQP
jgi:hypothetical protein